MTRQSGMLLLPVALMLMTVGALAYAMTRDGAMNVNTVDAQYDIESARYLAEAGVNLVKWRVEKNGCNTLLLGMGTVRDADGNQIDINSFAKGGGGFLNVDLTATTARGAVNRTVRTAPNSVDLHNLTSKSQTTINGSGGGDTFIRDGAAPPNNSPYLETTDGIAHGLLKFAMGAVPRDALLTMAEVQLYQVSSNSSATNRALAAHRMLRDWTASPTWTTPWDTPGGDYSPAPAASTAIDRGINQLYKLRIDALALAWSSQVIPNNGMLLKPNGLFEARFASFEAGVNQPQLAVRFYPHCK